MKKINKIFATILILVGFIYLIKYGIAKDFSRILLSICSPILVVLPLFVKNKVNDKLVFIYYIYLFILMTLGCLGRFYSKFTYYDVFAHFMFGFAGCIVGLYILNLFSIQNKSIVFNVIFMIFTTLALSSLWEIFEYIASIVFKEDVQYALTTGVSDTMEDIISSLISCSLFQIIYVFRKEKIDKIVKCQ